MNKNQTISGFSLIELLVVITIIGLLTLVILANSSKGRTKAYATQILSDFHSIESALTFMAVDHGIARWWTGNKGDPCAVSSFAPTIPGNPGCAKTPTIASLITNSPANGLAKYMSQAPITPVGIGTYVYNNEGGVFDPDGDNCSPLISWEVDDGAGILLWGMEKYPEIFEALDASIDNGDGPVCGRIRYYLTSGAPPPACTDAVSGNCNLLYMFSADGKF